jgi:hypothetical protein
MKHLKRYKIFLESLTQTDIEVNNQEQVYSGEYPNNKVLDNPIKVEQEVEIDKPTTEVEPSI